MASSEDTAVARDGLVGRTKLLRKTFRTVGRRLARDPGAVRHEGLALPPPETRQGGHHFKDDAAFLAAGRRDARRLQETFGVTTQTRVLDVGCGNGRLAIGLLAQVGEMCAYTGVDVAPRSIAWCRRHITTEHPGIRFVHVDVANARYNPAGRRLSAGYRLPLPDRSVDVIHLYSVFSHMEPEDVRVYLREFSRLLADGGGVFLTAFVEDDVEPVTVNPAGYGPLRWSGELHCVRYERGFFTRLVDAAGLRIDRFHHRSDVDWQSAIVLRAATASVA